MTGWDLYPFAFYRCTNLERVDGVRICSATLWRPPIHTDGDQAGELVDFTRAFCEVCGSEGERMHEMESLCRDTERTKIVPPDDATTIEDCGWTEVEAVDKAGHMPRRYFRVEGDPDGTFGWLEQPEDVSLVALAYRMGWCDGTVKQTVRCRGHGMMLAPEKPEGTP